MRINTKFPYQFYSVKVARVEKILFSPKFSLKKFFRENISLEMKRKYIDSNNDLSDLLEKEEHN